MESFTENNDEWKKIDSKMESFTENNDEWKKIDSNRDSSDEDSSYDDVPPPPLEEIPSPELDVRYSHDTTLEITRDDLESVGVTITDEQIKKLIEMSRRKWIERHIR
jgi:hypothetical protein